MTALLVTGPILAALVLWGIGIYNRFISEKQMMDEGASGIDVQLKRRNDLIPNLMESVKGYMAHESGVLSKVTEMRTQSQTMSGQSMQERAKTEQQLSGALNNLFAVAENYPELKANTTFIELQKSLNEIEDQIQLSRRYYNGAARNFNTLVQSFPNSLIADKFGFKAAHFFEIDNAAERSVPQVKF